MFVWSGENYIIPRNEQIRGYFTTEAVGDLLKGFWKSSHADHGLAKLVKHTEHKPELVVLFIDSELSSEELTKYHSLLPTVAHKMQESHSFYIPFVTASDSHHMLHSTTKAVHNAHKAGGNAYFLGSEQSLAHLKEHSESPVTQISSFTEIVSALANGKTDVLVVYSNDECPMKRLKFIDERVKELDHLFSEAKFSNYIAVFTGIETSLEEVLPSATELGVPEAVKRAVFAQATPFAAAPNGSYPPQPTNGRNTFNVYFNGVFWELFTVLIVFFGLIFFGIRQLLLLQAPDRIPAAAVAGKKKKQ